MRLNGTTPRHPARSTRTKFSTGADRFSLGRHATGYSTIYAVDHARGAEPTLTVGDFDRAITAVSEATGAGSAARGKHILGGPLCRATDEEAGFVKRLLTVAKAAGVPGSLVRRALMLSGDLTGTAEVAVAEGVAGLRGIGFEPFRPILTMSASTAESVGKAVASFDRASVEWKLDGIRIQLHRRGDEVRVYTRNLNEITHALPGIADAVCGLAVEQAVLDDEALWMGEGGPAAFQETVAQIDSDAPPEGVVTFLFDLLHVGGDDLLDSPLEGRAARLARIAPQLKIPGVFTSDEAARHVLDESLGAGHEGVVVKDAASTYGAGRRGKAWLS